MDVKQKLLFFENMQADERAILKTAKFKSTLQRSLTSADQLSSRRVLPMLNRRKLNGGDVMSGNKSQTVNANFHTSVDEERSEDDGDDVSDYVKDELATNAAAESLMDDVKQKLLLFEIMPADEHIILKTSKLKSILQRSLTSADQLSSRRVLPMLNRRKPNGGGVPNKSPMLQATNVNFHTSIDEERSEDEVDDFSDYAEDELATNAAGENSHSTPRLKTEILGTTNRRLIGKFNSEYHAKDDEEEEEIELRDKCDKFIHPILEELIKTEETYVEKLVRGIQNYGNIFQRLDLPIGLLCKKHVLLGEIEQIAEFHRDQFLPMLLRNRRDLKRLFDEFQLLIDQNCFYSYAIFTINKQKSLQLCDEHKDYFKLIQTELGDKLGISSFLLQPIQRMARYPLLLQQFISILFKNRHYVLKPLIVSCCRLENKLRTLLTTINESVVINDIVDCHEFSVIDQGKLRQISEFKVFDHTLKRSYRSKVFIFDKCIINTEIKRKNLVFRGHYPWEYIGILTHTKTFTLFYERRKQQECDFHGDPALIEMWLQFIRDMIRSYVMEKRLKLQECEADHLQEKPPSSTLLHDSNHFSSDSGIGDIWVSPNKGETQTPDE